MRCHEVMTRNVESVAPGICVNIAAKKMRDTKIGFLPVCDRDGVVLGLLTDRDIVIRVCAEGVMAERTPVSAIMTRDVIACRPDDDIRRVETLMASYKKSRIPVTSSSRRLLGVISLSDIAQVEKPTYTGRILRQVSSRGVRSDEPIIVAGPDRPT